MNRSKKGFTLIEMLAVIAIIAVLVAIIVPAIGNSTDKAKASADAANLRTVLSQLNIHVVNGEKTVSEIIDQAASPTSKVDPDAQLYAVFDAPGFIHVYYVTPDGEYYSLDYLSEYATNGKDSAALDTIGLDQPTVEGKWYKAGVAGEITVLP